MLVLVGFVLPARTARAQEDAADEVVNSRATDAPPAAEGEANGMTFGDAVHALYAPAAEDRLAAVRRLSELGDRAALPSLREVVRQDPDPSVRLAAVSALAGIGGADVLDILREVAAEDSSPGVRDGAAGAVRGLGGAPTTPPIEGWEVPPVPAAPPPPPPATDQPAGGEGVEIETKIHFEGEGGDRVRIDRLVARFSGWAMTMSDGPALLEGTATTTVCWTPCWTTVPGGIYTFMADGYEFRVAARGEEQTWRVEGNSTAGLWIGGIATVGGFAMAIAGAVLLGLMGVEDDSVTANGALLGTGLGLAALGIPLWVFSYGSAVQVIGPSGASAANGLRVAPGILAARTPTGDSAWGVSLAMTL
jgi:hypothetical protein